MHSNTAEAVTDYILQIARHIIQRQHPQLIRKKFLNKLRFLKTYTTFTTIYENLLFLNELQKALG